MMHLARRTLLQLQVRRVPRFYCKKNAEIEKREIAAGAMNNWIRVARLVLNYAALPYFRSDIRAGMSGREVISLQ